MDDGGAAAPPQADRTVDALGLLCPLPVLRARQALERLPEGGVVLLLADDPQVRQDVPDWCAGSGHELLGLEVDRSGRVALWKCWIRRGSSGRADGPILS